MSDPAARHGGGHAAAALAIVCCAQLILAVDITIILVADVQVQHALGFTQALAYLVTTYCSDQQSELFGTVIGMYRSRHAHACMVVGLGVPVPVGLSIFRAYRSRLWHAI